MTDTGLYSVIKDKKKILLLGDIYNTYIPLNPY
jgi:hypothetical protein